MNYSFQNIQDWVLKIIKEVMDSITQPEAIIQLVIVLLCVGMGLVAGILIRKVFRNRIKLSDTTYPSVNKLFEVILKHTPLILVVILIFICLSAMQQLQYPSLILYFAGILIATQILSSLFKFTQTSKVKSYRK